MMGHKCVYENNIKISLDAEYVKAVDNRAPVGALGFRKRGAWNELDSSPRRFADAVNCVQIVELNEVRESQDQPR